MKENLCKGKNFLKKIDFSVVPLILSRIKKDHEYKQKKKKKKKKKTSIDQESLTNQT